MLEKAEEAKAIFLHEVGDAVWDIDSLIGILLTQLCPYWSGTETTQEANMPIENRSETAADILGLGHSCRCHAMSSLEHEVAAYLDDLEEGSGMLNFQQVWLDTCSCQDEALTRHVNPGELSLLSYHISVGHGHYSYSRLSCTLWMCILLSKGDHDALSELDFSWTHGSSASSEVFVKAWH